MHLKLIVDPFQPLHHVFDRDHALAHHVFLPRLYGQKEVQVPAHGLDGLGIWQTA